MNETRIYADGKLVDAPASSVSGTVNTVAGGDLRLGSLRDGTSKMAGFLDEIRISSVPRGLAWAKHSYESQRPNSNFIDYDLQYLSAPVMPADLNLTVVNGQAMSFQFRSDPPATQYSLNPWPPFGLSFNAATGVLSGTPVSYDFPTTDGVHNFSAPYRSIRILNSWHPHISTGNIYEILSVQVTGGALSSIRLKDTSAGDQWVGSGAGRGVDWEDTETLGQLVFTVTATNPKGSSITSMRVQLQASVQAPVISVGSIVATGGRTASLQGELTDSGGVANSVTLFYGDTDGVETPADWNHSLALGSHDQGPVLADLSGLNSGQTYYYRFSSTNAAGTDWSSVGTFETLSFDQGVLRFHTGTNELGGSAGLFWDKGDGEFKVMDANLSTVNYLAPDGTSWMLTKASFHFSDDFYLGPNLDKVILEGVNALSVSSDGNAPWPRV